MDEHYNGVDYPWPAFNNTQPGIKQSNCLAGSLRTEVSTLMYLHTVPSNPLQHHSTRASTAVTDPDEPELTTSVLQRAQARGNHSNPGGTHRMTHSEGT
jgi:hypothetical protein